MLTIGHQQVQQKDAWRTHRTPFGIDWKGLKQGDDQVHRFDQDRDLTWLRLAHADRGDFVDAYSLTLSRHQQAEDLERLRKNGRLDEQGFDVVAWGAALTLETIGSAGHWVYGVDYYRDVVDSYGTRTDPGAAPRTARQGPVADDATYDLVGVFLQNTVKTGAGVEITPGVRYTYAGLDADQVDQRPDGLSDSWDAVVGSLRVLLPLDEERKQTVHAGVSQGFRAPNLSDMTRLDSARSTELETPVDRLDPERFTTSEIGWRHNGDRWSAGVAYYYTWIDDMIVRAPTGNRIDDLDEVTKKNAGGGHVQGVELTAQAQLADDWFVRVMGMWMEGKVRSYPTSAPARVEDDISRVMPLTGQLALRWQPKGRSFWVEGVVDAADKADRLSADDARDTQRIPPGGTPGYVVGSLRTGFDLSRTISITVALENLTDEDYRIHGSGVNEPGRQVVAQVTGRF
jgi:hemoglobin/transferrin/lactoferrin receptor protein